MDIVPSQRGTSLVEVMMAVLIFSVGLLGLAGLLLTASRSNHAAYLRTQAIFLANGMADRMSANSPGVWSGSYDSAGYPLHVVVDPCADGAACDSAAVAAHDQRLWSSQLTTFLPHPKAAIQCSGIAVAGIHPNPKLGARPPYGGSCKMSVSWSERGTGDDSHRGDVVQSLAWEFQP